MNKSQILVLVTTLCLICSATSILAITHMLATSRLKRAEMARKQISMPVIEVEETIVQTEVRPKVEKSSQEPKNQNPLIIKDGVNRNAPPRKPESPAEAIEKIKSATSLLHIISKNGVARTGTAFVVYKSQERIILVTHSQLVVWDDEQIAHINCSFKTGGTGSTFSNGKICGEIEGSNLILLETASVPGVESIDLAESVAVKESLPILALGFPFGKALATGNLGPSVSVTSGIVSSVRRDPLENALYYQLDCKFNPGNAGGPVVTEDGKLVGVAFSKVQGAAFGFVEPIDKLVRAISGSLSSVRVQEVDVRNGTRIFNVGFKQFDPHRNVAKFDVLTFRKSSMLNVEKVDGRWGEASEEWHAHPMFAGNAIVTGDVRVPENASDLYFQIRAESKNGSFTYLKPVELAATSAKVQDKPDTWEKLKLPSAFTDVDIAGGGRYLIFHLAELKKLTVFDTHTRTFVKEIELHGNGICAAGADRILFVHQKNILSWDLKTFELARTAKLTYPDSPTAIAIGNSSHGPILIGGRPLGALAVQFLDLETLETIEIADGKAFMMERESTVRASGNGLTFARFRQNTSDCGALFIDSNSSDVRNVIGVQKTPTKPFETEVMYLQPNQDGTRLFTNLGIFTRTWKPTSQRRWTKEDGWPLPAVQGNYFLVIARRADNSETISIEHEEVSDRLLPRIVLPGDGASLLERTNDSITLDQRVYFMPEDKVMVVLPKFNREMYIRRFDIDYELSKSRQQHLFVTSQPPVRATVGVPLEYQLKVKSKRKVVAFDVKSGPEGLGISQEGKVTWTPNLDEVGDQQISVSIADDWGTTNVHSFSLKVEKSKE